MYKLASIGMLGLLALFVVPAPLDDSNDGRHYGAATMLVRDAEGNEVFSQTVHNRITDQGEDYLLNQVFTDLGSTAVVDNVQIGAICLNGDGTSPAVAEADTASSFNTDNSGAAGYGVNVENCQTDSTVTSASQIATVDPGAFTAGADTTSFEWVSGATSVVSKIGVCVASATDVDVRDCTTTLFATVDTSDVTLANSGETVTITYTFDISSSGT